jgi:hypothetical protein
MQRQTGEKYLQCRCGRRCRGRCRRDVKVCPAEGSTRLVEKLQVLQRTLDTAAAAVNLRAIPPDGLSDCE